MSRCRCGGTGTHRPPCNVDAHTYADRWPMAPSRAYRSLPSCATPTTGGATYPDTETMERTLPESCNPTSMPSTYAEEPYTAPRPKRGQSDDRAYATLSFRAVLMGFLRAMTLYVMCGMQWTDEISEFAAWTVRYDMWCKMHFFGDLLHQDLEAEANAAVANPRNLLGMLPHEFTRQDAQELRIAQGRNANPKNMLAQWTHRGYITYDEQRGVYVKSRA